PHPTSPLFPYTTLFRSQRLRQEARLEDAAAVLMRDPGLPAVTDRLDDGHSDMSGLLLDRVDHDLDPFAEQTGHVGVTVVEAVGRSEEHTSELQSRFDLV